MYQYCGLAAKCIAILLPPTGESLMITVSAVGYVGAHVTV